MKLMHLSDLHLGKRVNEFSMIEDQRYILSEIISIVDDKKPDGVIIAGDVYDKSIPSTEAVELFDDFLVQLAKRQLQVYIISGNHDSPERLSFGNRIMDASGIHFSSVYSGVVTPFSCADEYGTVNIYMLPFIKPVHVHRFYPEEEINTYNDALNIAVKKMNLNLANRNILITHQFVTGALRSDSEEVSIGGADNVEASVFLDFDYVALGHIHRPQYVYSEKIRYSGTPLKYSFSEATHKKSVTIVELKEKGNICVDTIPLVPLHDMVEVRGKYAELMFRSFYEETTLYDDYIHITLTDEEDIPDAISKLRVVYHNLMKLDYDNTRTKYSNDIYTSSDLERKSPIDLFTELYRLQNGTDMSSEQMRFMKKLIEQVWEDQQ